MSARRLVSAAAAALLACGVSSVETYRVEGSVVAVDREAGRLEIAHEEIPGFMPAMTMSFEVASPELLEGVEPGAELDFVVERRGTLLRVTALEVTGRGPAPGTSGPSSGAVGGEAPDFELTDQDGRTLRLRDLRGHAVLLDFIFTRCPGPCPLLTATHVRVQRELPDALAPRVRFVSITVDPEHDGPAELRAYAEARGASLETWSFLGGEPERVGAVIRSYHVGTVRRPDGELDHTLATFLIDPSGAFARRYLGTAHSAEEVLEDLADVLS